MNKKIKHSENTLIKGVWDIYLNNAKTGELIKYIHQENVICTVGLNALAAQTCQDKFSKTTFKVTYGAVGTDNTAPAAGDTTLGAEIDRVQLASASSSGAVGTLNFFFNSSQGNGALKEMGAFANGWDGSTNKTASETSNTGVLLSHVAINVAKTSSETLTCLYTITYS